MTQELKELIDKLKPLAGLRAPFDTFALGDGSGVYFCSSCGRRSDPPVAAEVKPEGGAAQAVLLAQPIAHKSDCAREAHYRAIAALKQALVDISE